MLRAGSRAHKAMLVLVLSMALPFQSVRAGTTEIVVGATVLFQALQVVAELVPQLAALGASVNALGSAGKELVQTGQRLIHMLFPNMKAGITRKSKKTEPVVVPVFTGPKVDAPAPDAAPPADAAGDEDEDIQLSALVGAYRERGEAAALSHGATGGPAASLTRGAESWESLSNATSQRLVEMVRGGERKKLAKFLAAVDELSPEDRGAVKPAVHGAASKGAKFSKLHGEDDPSVADGFRKLRQLDEKLK